MPTRAPRACPHCGKLQPCPVHTRRPWAGRTSPAARGYNTEYRRVRAQVMAEETHCAICGGAGLANDEADHRVPLSKGGTNDRANLRRAHRRCNQGRGVRA